MGEEIPAYPIRFIMARLQPPKVPVYTLQLPWSGWMTTVAKPEEFKDKVTMLHFWSYWCPPCVEELPEIVEFARAHESILRLVPIVEASSKAPELVLGQTEQFLADKTWKADFQWRLDHQWELLKAFWGLSIPATVFLNPEGLVALIEENEITTPMIVGPRPWHDDRYAKLVRDIFEDNNVFKAYEKEAR